MKIINAQPDKDGVYRPKFEDSIQVNGKPQLPELGHGFGQGAAYQKLMQEHANKAAMAEYQRTRPLGFDEATAIGAMQNRYNPKPKPKQTRVKDKPEFINVIGWVCFIGFMLWILSQVF